MNSLTQDMKYRQSLMNYAIRYGVSRASRKYNHYRSYRQEEIKLIGGMRRRNPKLGLTELWFRKRQGMMASKPKQPQCQAKPYQQMTFTPASAFKEYSRMLRLPPLLLLERLWWAASRTPKKDQRHPYKTTPIFISNRKLHAFF